MNFVIQKTKTKLRFTDDRELVLLARSGRQDAFVEIVSRYQNLVVGVAFSMIQDFAKSEDAAQDSFVKAWKSMRDLREPHRLRPWLAQISRNTALNHLRKNRPEDSSIEDFELIEDPASQPDELLVQAEERATVLKALASLPEKYRLPLVLFYCDEKSIRGVAEALNLSEDAVKQRLSRGRSRLRERMSGLIDSVLGSARLGRSNALFTASVATAIGALTKPSAMAATAMSTGTTQTTLSTSLAMTSSKSTLSTVALLMAVSLPIGYSAHKFIEGDPPPTVVTQTVGLDSHSKSTADPIKISMMESQLVKQWRKLRANYGDQHSDLIQLYAEVAAIPNRIHRRAFTAVLISEWAELDAAKGLAFFREENGEDWERDLFLQEMFKSNVEQAIDVLMASGDAWEEFAPQFLDEIARQAPHRLAALVELLPTAKYHRDLSVENAFDLYAQNNLQAARRAAEEVSGPNRPRALAGIARAWAVRDGEAALAWAEGIDESGLRESTMEAVLVGWARIDPHAALDRSKAELVMREAAKHDLDATIAWISENHEQLVESDYRGLQIPMALRASTSFDQRLLSDPIGFLSNLDDIGVLGPVMRVVEGSLMNEAVSAQEEIMEWLLTSETSPAKTDLAQTVLNSLARSQPESAMKIADGIADPKKREKAIKSVLSGMTNGGNTIDTADQVFDSASPSWKEAITASVFARHFGEMPNFQKWADRMHYLPESSRLSGHRSMGLRWAEIEPMNAFNWALAQSDNAQREAAIDGASRGWASSSPGDAREWIESQLSASDQKIAASGFVQGAFWGDYDEAVAMVKTAPSDQTKIELIEGIIKINGTNNWRKVLQIIEEVGLPEAQQEELRQSVTDKQ